MGYFQRLWQGWQDVAHQITPDAAPSVARAERCAGCGAEAVQHPMVGVLMDGRGFRDVPVCAACHADPTHRTTPLKAHFFARADRQRAVAVAGRSSLGA